MFLSMAVPLEAPLSVRTANKMKGCLFVRFFGIILILKQFTVILLRWREQRAVKVPTL